MMGDDAVELGERLDLVDDHLAHLRGVVGGLLRHFQHAAAQLVARRLELLVHFGSHLLHGLHHRAEPLGRLLEHRIRFVGALLVEVVHGIEGLLPLVLGRSPYRFELPADRSRSGAGGFRHHARDVAGALFGRGERFVEQAGEARQPLIEIGGAQIDGGHQRFKLRLAIGDRRRGVAVGLLDHGSGLDQRLAVAFELARQRAEIFQRLRRLAVEDGQLVFQRLGRDAVARGDVVHRRHEVGHAGHQRALQRIEVVVGAGQHFLQQDVAFAQALEQRDRIGAQDLAGLLHFGDGRDRNLTRLVDGRARRLLEILQRLGYRAGGEIACGRDRARDFRAVGRHRLREAWPRVSIDFRASAVTRSMSVVSCVVLALSASTSEPRRLSTICARRSVCC